MIFFSTQINYLTGIINGDLHDGNLIVRFVDDKLVDISSLNEFDEYQSFHRDNNISAVRDLFGIIDFGETCISWYIIEVGQIIRDFMVSTNPDNSHAIALKHRSINIYEADILFHTIMTALCQYYVVGEYEFLKQPGNVYTKSGSEEASDLLIKHYTNKDEFWANALTRAFSCF